MKSLSKSEEKERDALVAALQESQLAVESAMETFIEKQAEFFEPVTAAVEAYNEAVAAAEGFRQYIASQIEDYMSDKSEKWLEGERGEAYQAWRETWEEALEEVELSELESVTLSPDMEAAEKLLDLPSEVE